MSRTVLPILLALFPGAALALSADDLAGAWCYTHYEAGGETEAQNITYVFEADGTLRYQNNPGTPVEKPGTWALDGDSLEIKPTFMMFNLTVKESDTERFVLDAFGDHVFERGECG